MAPIFHGGLEKTWAMKTAPSCNSSIKRISLLVKLIILFQVSVLTKNMNKAKKLLKSWWSYGILENKRALLKRAVAGPIISDLIDQANQDLQNPEKPPKHHENTDLCEKNFSNDRKSFLGALMEYGNPFWEEEPMLAQIVLKYVLDENATSSAKRARKIGFDQFVSFINYRL